MILEHFHLRQQLDTIEDPYNKHTMEDQGCSWTTRLKNCVADFLIGALIMHPILWEIN